jgi:hypothetical protein
MSAHAQIDFSRIQQIRQFQSQITGYNFGPNLRHGDPTKAVNIKGMTTSINSGPGNYYTFLPGGPRYTEGLGIDLSGDGKFDPQRDGYLSLDMNNDGKYDREDIDSTLQMLKAFSGSGDLDGRGGFDQLEQVKLQAYREKGKRMDLNQDGVLSSWELNRAGGRVVKDRSAESKPSESSRGPALEAYALPGSDRPDYNPRPQYYQRPFGFQPYGFGSPAFFTQFLHNFMSYFSRPY